MEIIRNSYLWMILGTVLFISGSDWVIFEAYLNMREKSEKKPARTPTPHHRLKRAFSQR